MIIAAFVFISFGGYLAWAAHKKRKNDPLDQIPGTPEDLDLNLNTLRDALIEGEQSGIKDGPINLDDLKPENTEDQ